MGQVDAIIIALPECIRDPEPAAHARITSALVVGDDVANRGMAPEQCRRGRE
jgi:hypothetical protein